MIVRLLIDHKSLIGFISEEFSGHTRTLSSLVLKNHILEV